MDGVMTEGYGQRFGERLRVENAPAMVTRALRNADVGQLVRREEPFVQWEAAASVRWHEPDDARVSCPDL